MRIPRRLLGRAQGRGSPPLPTPQKTQNLYFSMIFRGLGPGNPWKRSPGTIRTDTDPYESIWTPLRSFFNICFDTFLTICDVFVKTNVKVQHIICFNENQSCSYCDSVQDAPMINFWGPFFDDFVDISIFMIWRSWGILTKIG